MALVRTGQLDTDALSLTLPKPTSKTRRKRLRRPPGGVLWYAFMVLYVDPLAVDQMAVRHPAHAILDCGWLGLAWTNTHRVLAGSRAIGFRRFRPFLICFAAWIGLLVLLDVMGIK